MPFDPMELCMLPPDEVHVEIHLRCDHEMARKLARFFHDNGFEGAPKPREPKMLEPAVKALNPKET